MKESGMGIARINTKHGDVDQWDGIVSRLKKLGVKIMIDIKSKEVLSWVKCVKPDYVAVSFAEDVGRIREVRKIVDGKTKIVSKIETARGLRNVENLIDVSDGIMVARGDLGKSLSLERVPKVQRDILRKCGVKNKFDIVATEMLLSMINSKVPSSAEVGDVWNAVFLGASAVMLSEETAIGKYPVLAVQWMKKIVDEAEK